ncbi:dihydrofolate reductase [Mycoplasma iguanae]|uniref:dihydrofolate reductase n=1 Tax=Mycoplasma iguanae TaxID=292461 RepID=A0ABY5RA82_9MOLU|nr:dihydrofolate reductase [Mycoplasma iguanae]UVD81525.1 dihydrofolate reductase [Mycoplasma iguanae]
MLKAIWAMTKDGLVGKDNTIPWHIKEEFQHFRNTTLHQDVIMGKNTFLSLPKILDKRKMFVLSDDSSWKVEHENVFIIDSFTEVIKPYKNNPHKDLYVMGGIYVYEQMIPLCDELIVTIIKGQYTGNRYLKNIDFTPFEVIKKVEHELFDVFYYQRKN